VAAVGAGGGAGGAAGAVGGDDGAAHAARHSASSTAASCFCIIIPFVIGLAPSANGSPSSIASPGAARRAAAYSAANPADSGADRRTAAGITADGPEQRSPGGSPGCSGKRPGRHCGARWRPEIGRRPGARRRAELSAGGTGQNGGHPKNDADRENEPNHLSTPHAGPELYRHGNQSAATILFELPGCNHAGNVESAKTAQVLCAAPILLSESGPLNRGFRDPGR